MQWLSLDHCKVLIGASSSPAIAVFHAHLTAWWRMAHPNASLLSEDDRAFKVFYANLLLRWRWCYLQLLVATAGMPQPRSLIGVSFG